MRLVIERRAPHVGRTWRNRCLVVSLFAAYLLFDGFLCFGLGFPWWGNLVLFWFAGRVIYDIEVWAGL